MQRMCKLVYTLIQVWPMQNSTGVVFKEMLPCRGGTRGPWLSAAIYTMQIQMPWRGKTSSFKHKPQIKAQSAFVTKSHPLIAVTLVFSVVVFFLFLFDSFSPKQIWVAWWTSECKRCPFRKNIFIRSTEYQMSTLKKKK